ncbi:MAG: glycerol-3-phosphate 1-O-acyltransferase PlsY [Deinococcales bacterium]
MTLIFLTIICILLAYLLGSIPTGYLIAKAHGVDIQKIGSGNIGATNVLRSVGRIPALIVVILDPLKGALAVLIAQWSQLSIWGVALTGLAAILGNNFNVFLRFRGGKGIATSLGMFAPIDPLTTLAAALIGIFTIFLGRYVSLGSLVGIFAAILLHLKGQYHIATLLLVCIVFALAMFQHRSNLQRLAAGTERRLGQKSVASSQTTPDTSISVPKLGKDFDNPGPASLDAQTEAKDS